MERMLVILCLSLLANTASSAGPSVKLDTKAATALAEKHGCSVCHNPNTRLIGPSYVAISSRYHKEHRQVGKVAKYIKEGDKNGWGAALMPTNGKLSDTEALQLAELFVSYREAAPISKE